MIESAVLGGITGALARLAPEVIKAIDRRNERKHELRMNEHQLKVTELHAKYNLQSEQLKADSSQVVAGIEAIRSAYENMKTGFKFADSVSALIRPWVTVLFVGGWLASKIAAYATLQAGGIDWATAITSAWGEPDWAILSGILNFWFLGRVFEKRA